MRIIAVKKILSLLFLLSLSVGVYGQYFTNNHDASVYNQFLVMETGNGRLTPSLWYRTLHRGYSKWATSTSKNNLRLDFNLEVTPQEKMSEEIDSALTSRAKIEAMNMADRMPKALDLAWQSEKSKIEKKFALFRENINKITMCGGSSQDYRDWKEIYNCLQMSLQAVRDAYMPLTERKEQYLEIYHDIVSRNQQLVTYITSLRGGKEARDLLNNKTTPHYSRLRSHATAAYGRWKVSMAAGVLKK